MKNLLPFSTVPPEQQDELARKTINVTLSAKARVIVEKLREDTGVPNTTAMERLLEWFAGLDRKFRLAILLKDEEARRELAADALAKLAGIDGTKALSVATAEMDHTEMAKAIRGLTDRLEVLCTAYKRDAERALKKERGK